MTDNNLIQGLHHLAMRCYKKDYDKVFDFYYNILGLNNISTWGDNEIPDGILIDVNNSKIEIFTNKEEDLESGIIYHYALKVTSVDHIVDKVKKAGYEIFLGPKEMDLPADKTKRIKIAFCYGPIGEQIEFFEELN